MIRQLKKHGNSHALVLEKPVMEALGITPESKLQVTINGRSLVITPAEVGLGREAVEESLKKLRPRYNDMLKKLAE
jgi:antitoxin component of MazEF toxin-antitoxin module